METDVRATERLLVRLGLDLHDGPLQQVHLLAQDVRLLREQVRVLLAAGHSRPVLGRFDDVEAQLAELYRDLRDLAHSLEPRSLLEQPVEHAVAAELALLERRSGVSTSLTLDGSFADLSASQRIALLRVLQEALSNIRQHSGARSTAVTLTSDGNGVRLAVTDDGRGFDPRTIVQATEQDAGLGLAGMRQRIRLLGGTLDVTSRPGGPTVIVATTPRWHAGAGADADDATRLASTGAAR